MTALAREIAATGLRPDQCHRRIRDRRIIAARIEDERRQQFRRAVDLWRMR